MFLDSSKYGRRGTKLETKQVQIRWCAAMCMIAAALAMKHARPSLAAGEFPW